MSLMPTGVLMPVESMSMRVLIGMVQALVNPGNWMALFSSSVNSSTEIVFSSGSTMRNGAFSQSHVSDQPV